MRTSTEPSPVSLPTINYIWIGPPPLTQKFGAPIDTTGPLQMAEYNKSNPLQFWCLEEYKNYYEKKLNEKKSDAQRIIVRSIEEDLAGAPEEMKEIALKVKTIMQTLLGEWRNHVRDRAIVKELISIWLMHGSSSNYILDTNITASKFNFSLPDDHTFRIPAFEIPPNHPSNTECWFMFAPPRYSEVGNIINSFYKFWLEVEKVYDKVGYSEEYYFESRGLVLRAIWDQLRDNVNYWKISGRGFRCEIPELSIRKFYENTHLHHRRNDYESPENLAKEKVINFLNAIPLLKSHTMKIKNNIASFFHETKKPVETKVILPPSMTLEKAINSKNSEAVKELIKQGADVNQFVSEDEGSLLHLAVFNKSFECFKALVENGAKTDVKMLYDDEMCTPIELAQKINRSFYNKIVEEMKLLNSNVPKKT